MTDRRFVFLRAINTGGRRLTNDELLAPFDALGLTDAAAYQAAGNVTFRSDRPTDDLKAALDLEVGTKDYTVTEEEVKAKAPRKARKSAPKEP